MWPYNFILTPTILLAPNISHTHGVAYVNFYFSFNLLVCIYVDILFREDFLHRIIKIKLERLESFLE